MKILMIDNYDSFTYNLVYMVRQLGYTDIDVFRNDQITLEQIESYDKIILSPGPGIPDEAGLLKEIIRTYGSTKSILGICLGHQAIAEVYGGALVNMEEVKHGIATDIQVDDKEDYMFKELPPTFIAGHYHSWVVEEPHSSSQLMVTARGLQHQVMALKHKQYDVRGLQFHPESILTPEGTMMISNFLKQKQ